MSFENIFKRYEIKYLITKEQKELIKTSMQAYMQGDQYGRSTIHNIYFDTPDYLLVRRSIEKPFYKEKLRVRSYGVATAEAKVFVELKKKYDSVVYKRRISMTEEESVRYTVNREKITDSQISREIDYCFKLYNSLQPTVFLSYEREAFFSKTDLSFRLTFDENVLWRDYDLSLRKGAYGTPVLDSGLVIMEVKTAGGIPLWFTEILSKNHIYKTSFSKYGNAYKQIFEREKKQEDNKKKGEVYNVGEFI